MYRAIRLTVSVTLLATILISTSGCSLFDNEPALKDVAEHSGAFHFQIPETWQVNMEAGLIAVYAAEELPTAEDAIDTLSVLVFTGDETTSTPAADMLVQFVEQRSVQRGWIDPVIGQIEDATIGGRDAYRIDIEATSPDDLRFVGRFYLTRTAGHDVLLITIVPVDKAESFDDEIEALTKNWFWHR